MSRLISTVQNDMIIQVRKNYYSVTILLAVLFAIIFSLILNAEQIRTVIPVVMLFIVGGTTMIFIGGLIIEEKEKGILKAVMLSPLRIHEYLSSKIITLVFLSTLEVGIMVGGPLAYFHFTEGIMLPNISLLLIGILTLNLIYTLLGLAITVRFRKVTDYMIPVVMIMIFLQVPTLYFSNILRHPLILLIPSGAPVMIIQGAFISLSTAEWLYAIIYAIVLLVTLIIWARRAYYKHIVLKLD